ncbi:hypothetical protein ACHQM5_014676 [Ranunculus cassubicifolius]
MGKTSKWIRNFLTGGKKVKVKGEYICSEDNSISAEMPKTPMVVHPSTPKEKKRWSFRRSASGGKGVSSIDLIVTTPRSFSQGCQKDQKLVMTDAPVTVAKAQATAVRLSSASRRRHSVLQDAAATMIQSVFRSYLARKALTALKGIVKLQALMRGHLVRKQTVTTLRCMQALVNVQVRTRAQRIQLAEEAQFHNQRTPYRNSPQTTRFRPTYNMHRHVEEGNIRVAEMDYGESRESTRRRNSYSDYNHFERPNQRYYQQYQENLKKNYQYQMAIALSGLTDMSPDVCRRHFDEYSVSSQQSSPYCYSNVSKQDPTRGPCSSPQPYEDTMSNDQTLFPNYMANTKSFKAKARSQSAPKQRLNFLERQPSRRKGSIDGKYGRAAGMQRSSSPVGPIAQAQEFPWSIRLDKSGTSFNDSECGSANTVLN